MSSRNSRLFEIVLVAILMATYFYAAFSEAHNFGREWFIRDDAFFYFKVAQNISEGHGSTLDGINPTNGYHPLWMIVCIPIFALARFDLILPLRLIVILSGAISAATGVLLHRLVGRTLSPPAAILAATYWCFDRAIHYNVTMFGLETGLAALTMTAFLLAVSRLEPDFRRRPLASRQLWTLGGLAVAMLLSRLDTIFLAGLAGMWILLRGTSIRSFIFLDFIIIVFSAFVSLAARTGFPDYFVYTKSALTLAALGVTIQIPVFYLLELYNPPKSSSISSLQLRILLAALLGAGLASGLMILFATMNQLEGLPRSALPLYAGLILAGTGIIRLAARLIAKDHPAPGRFAEVRERWRQWMREGIHFYGILFGALGAYMLANKILFDTFTPVSGQVKAWWGALQGSSYGNPIADMQAFLGLAPAEGMSAWGPIVYSLNGLAANLRVSVWLMLGAMIVFTLAVFFTRVQRALRAANFLALPLLLAGSLAQTFYYTGLGYTGAKDWYWVSAMLMFTLIGALLFDLILRPLRHFKNRKTFAYLATGILALFMIYRLETNLIQRMPYRALPPGTPYLDVVQFLEEHTEPGALIGMTGGGAVAYFIEERVVVNMDGLINSHDYFLALQSGRADQYLVNIGLDYIFSNPDILKNSPYNGQFDEWSWPIAQFGKKDLLKYQP
ncbi:MAG: hypothetical protein HFACDABA_01155 [Anaerolineales bacterium]|nr:hypothetical protein [Anaerolineales bacterium]